MNTVEVYNNKHNILKVIILIVHNNGTAIILCLLLTPSITSSVYKLWLSVCSCSLSDWALSSNSLVSILMIVIWVMWHIIPTHSMQVHYALCLNIKLSIIQDCINTSKFSICWYFIHFISWLYLFHIHYCGKSLYEPHAVITVIFLQLSYVYPICIPSFQIMLSFMGIHWQLHG